MTQTTFLDPSTSPLMAWVPTQEAAAERLNQFCGRAGASYAKRRNYDLCPADRSSVSALSPWLRHRVLLEEDVLRTVLQQHTLSSAEKFVQEVLWRGYFKGWLEHHPTVWVRYKSRLLELADQLEKDQSLEQRYADAIGGQTGIECFDAWSTELVQHGYLHNHARMWFASLWIFTLRLPWELGADFFLRHLLDGDPASNTCSWRWVGGLHTKGKTYLARADNIEKFTEGRFNPDGELALKALPLQESNLPPPREIAPIQDEPEEGCVGLLITEEDCSPESLHLSRYPTSVLALASPTERSIWPTGELARSFSSGSVNDAAQRAEAAFSVPVEMSDDNEWAQVIADWAAAHHLDAVVTARLPVGSVRKRVINAMKVCGLPLVEITRPYDWSVWPHTKRGFFALKKKIPSIIEHLV
ncbi:MAG: FAD-binding domain-containing protein [Pseudomonadota bacterium]